MSILVIKRPMLLLLSPAEILALDLTSILPIIFLFSRKRNVGLRFRKGALGQDLLQEELGVELMP